MRWWWSVASLALSFAQAQDVAPRPFKLEELQTQPGFDVSIYARVNGGPRHMTVGPNGVLYVAARGNGAVVAIPQQNQVVTVLRGLNGPHTLLFRNGDLYVSVDNGVLRFRDAVSADLTIRSPAERLVTLPSGGQHTTRTLGFGPDGKLYVTAGSTCNFCVEADPHRAAMMQYAAAGSGEAVYAKGLRNSVSFAWHPVTGDLWALDNGGDDLGDDIPPEEINIIVPGGDYGWPDCFGQQRGVKWGPQAQPDRCGNTIGPVLEMTAHMAPLGISFYSGDGFPASFQNDALVALHGSWNRTQPSGFKVIRVRASSGRPAGQEDFLWGFLDPATRTRSGRPVQAISGPDGAVYVSDDATGNIYRIGYSGPRINPGGIVQILENIYTLYGENLVNASGDFGLYANGIQAQTLYVGPTQVNFVLPDGLSGDVSIEVKNDRAVDEALIRVQ